MLSPRSCPHAAPPGTAFGAELPRALTAGRRPRITQIFSSPAHSPRVPGLFLFGAHESSANRETDLGGGSSTGDPLRPTRGSCRGWDRAQTAKSFNVISVTDESALIKHCRRELAGTATSGSVRRWQNHSPLRPATHQFGGGQGGIQIWSCAYGFHLAKVENSRPHNIPIGGCGCRDSSRSPALVRQSRPRCGMAMQPHSDRR